MPDKLICKSERVENFVRTVEKWSRGMCMCICAPIEIFNLSFRSVATRKIASFYYSIRNSTAYESSSRFSTDASWFSEMWTKVVEVVKNGGFRLSWDCICRYAFFFSFYRHMENAKILATQKSGLIQLFSRPLVTQNLALLSKKLIWLFQWMQKVIILH